MEGKLRTRVLREMVVAGGWVEGDEGTSGVTSVWDLDGMEARTEGRGSHVTDGVCSIVTDLGIDMLDFVV